MSNDLVDKRDLLLNEEECHPFVEDGHHPNDGDATTTFKEDHLSRRRLTADDDPNNSGDIYAYYREALLPAIASSLPLLYRQLLSDVRGIAYGSTQRVSQFLVPESLLSLLSSSWSDFRKEEALLSFEWHDVHRTIPSTILEQSNWIHGNFTQFLLRNFDTDGDGHISASELLHINLDSLPTIPPHFLHPTQSQTWLRWFQCAWPLLDWKIGLFLWRTCGSFLLLVAIATIIPGRLHGLAGRTLRWPILAMTYVMITAELIVYVSVRLFIRVAEATFTTRRHRRLRGDMEGATSYDGWYNLAKELDISQDRDRWRNTVADDTSRRYNWTFIDELISDMRIARKRRDFALAMTVLQQCTRKNVGGIMSEDLFAFTNTGEPKDIVKVFLEEVETTLRWLTREVMTVEKEEEDDESMESDLVSKDSHSFNEDGVGAGGNVVKTTLSKDDGKANSQSSTKHEKNLLDHALDLGSIVADWAMYSFVREDHQSTHRQSTPKPRDETKKPIHKTKTTHTATKKNKVRSTVVVEPPPHIRNENQKLLQQERERVTTFLKRARSAYGRTALCLSGGAMMGCYHFGHVKALLEEGLLPDIISGTSSGSVVAAMICTRTNEEIERDMRPEILVDRLTVFSRFWIDRLQSVYENGTLFDVQEWLDLVKWFCCGDLTFEEAYQKTGRILNITLSVTTKKAPPVLVNYITAPCVTIASAVVASAAVPGFIKPVLLQVKGPDGVVRNQGPNKDQSYWDGSIDQDIPLNGLAEMFNCQFFLAAQCNPHIVPFFHNSKGDVGRPSRWSRGMRQDSWRGGFLLAALELYLKSDMRAKFHFLNDLEAAVGFTSTMMTQVYGGTTTIVPQISIFDYFKLFSNPTLPFLKQCFQVGSVAAYRHCAMMKSHYGVSHAIDECLATLEEPSHNSVSTPKRRTSKKVSWQSHSLKNFVETQKRKRGKGYSLNASVYLNERFEDLGEHNNIGYHSKAVASSIHDNIQDDLI